MGILCIMLWIQIIVLDFVFFPPFLPHLNYKLTMQNACLYLNEHDIDRIQIYYYKV